MIKLGSNQRAKVRSESVLSNWGPDYPELAEGIRACKAPLGSFSESIRD